MNHKLDHLHLMRLLVTIVDKGSFVKAANFLGITATKASKDIKHLENELQTKLLLRSTRSFKLTDAGEKYYKTSLDILALHQELIDNIQNSKNSLQGELRLSAPSLWGKTVLTPIIIAFKKHYPGVNIISEYSNRRADLQRENIHICFRSTELTNEPYLARFITEDNYVLCAAQDYLLKSEPITSPDDLDNHQMICLSQRDRMFEKITFLKDAKEINKHFRGDLAFSDKESIHQAVSQGLGIALLPHYLVRKDIKNGQLLPLLSSYPIKGAKFYALYCQRRQESALIDHFITFVIEQVKRA